MHRDPGTLDAARTAGSAPWVVTPPASGPPGASPAASSPLLLGLLGLAWLLEQAPWILAWLRYGGAAFLLAMGLSALRSAPADADDDPAELPAVRRSFWIGVTTNLLNPKAALFFVALFSAVLTSSTSPGLRLLLGSWIVLSTGAWFSLVAFGLGHPRVRTKLQARAWQIDRAMGGLLVLLALLVLLG